MFKWLFKTFSPREYNELITAKEYWLNYIDKALVSPALPEVQKWFYNLILKEVNKHTMYWYESDDNKLAERIRYLWHLNKQFTKDFTIKTIDNK